MTSLDRVLTALSNYDPREMPSGGWICRCPGPLHRRGDSHPGLKIDYDPAGKVLVKCHAGCPTKDILAAVGLRLSDLFDEEPQKAHVTATYPYRDEAGTLLYEAVRRSDKSFSQRRPDGQGGWVYSLNGTRRVLYRLGDINANPGRVVFLTEGEKDSDNLAAMGLVATTSPQGAGKWKPEYAELLRDRQVVILPDHDQPGYDHAKAVAASLAGVAKSVRVLALPGLALKGDVSDWLAKGHTVEELKALAANAPSAERFTPPMLEKPGDGFVWLDDLLDEPDAEYRWLIDGLFTVGGLSIVNARPKTGKSTLGRSMAVAVAAGTPVLGRRTTQGTVLLMCHEEQREEIKLALRKLNPQRGLRVALWTNPAPEKAVEWLRESIEKYKPALVIIDTLSAFFGITDINSNSEMTAHLKPILALARESGCHVCIFHWNSKQADGAMGATSIFGTVDISLNITKDDDGHRVIYTEGQRSGVPIPRTILALDPATGRSFLAGEQVWVEMESCAQAILDALDRDSDTETNIARKVGRAALTVSRTLREMKERGYLIAERKGATTYYRVAHLPVPRPVFGPLGTTGTERTQETQGTDEEQAI